jgi:hypothetical protein
MPEGISLVKNLLWALGLMITVF